MKYRVHHRTSYTPVPFAVVAEVESATLGDVFRLTNHIDHEWWENDGVTLVGEKTRSTSVGDMIEEVDSGVLYRVAPVGFEQVNTEAGGL